MDIGDTHMHSDGGPEEDDEDDEEESQTTSVFLDFGAAAVDLDHDKVRIEGIDTACPIVQVGSRVFHGEWMQGPHTLLAFPFEGDKRRATGGGGTGGSGSGGSSGGGSGSGGITRKLRRPKEDEDAVLDIRLFLHEIQKDGKK